MEKIETRIDGLYILKNPVFNDNRGVFNKPFSENDFEKNNLECDFKEFYYSINYKNSLRGMHFQFPPMDHVKLVYVSNGSIIDVVLDIRVNSETYGKYFTTILKGDHGSALYIPRGLAHGFLAQEDNSIVNYAQTSCYSREHDAGIKYDSFGFDWGVLEAIVSDRDKHFPSLNDFVSPFC